jgi:hypothetical protein
MAEKKGMGIFKTSVKSGEKLSDPPSQGAGLTSQGPCQAYRIELTQAAKLQDTLLLNPKTKKDEGRKKSFCARMRGVVAKAKGPATRARASLGRWKCR